MRFAASMRGRRHAAAPTARRRVAFASRAAALLGLAVLAGSAAAQSTTLVSNTGQTAASGSLGFGTFSGVKRSVAVSFTTGTNTAGYTLSAVDVKLASGTPSAHTRVSIYSTSGSPAIPNSSLHVLANPDTLSASATNTFSVAAGASLAPNMTYAVVFEVTSGTGTVQLVATASDDEDAGKASGWSIANDWGFRTGTGLWPVPNQPEVPLIKITGTAREADTLVSNTGQTAASGSLGFGTFSGVKRSVAVSFTTGTNTAGYTLSAVDVKLASGTPSAHTRVSIYSTSGSPAIPNSSLHVLANPDTLSASATNTFSVAAGASLAPNMTYAVVFEVTSGTGTVQLVATASDDEDAGKASGWSIANDWGFRTGTGLWPVPNQPEVPLIKITGTGKSQATPEVSVSGGSAVDEGGNAIFTVSASPAPSSSLTVNLSISQTGSFVAATHLGSKTVTVTTTGSATYSVSTVNDSTDETNGSVTAMLGSGSGYTLHATNTSASVTVNDNDGTPPPNPEVSISGGSAVSEGGSATFTVSASPAPTSNLTVSLSISQTGSFVAATHLGSKTVTVTTTGSATYSVPTVNDGTDEPNGSVTAMLGSGSGYTLHATNTSASVTVNDNDDPADTTQPPTDSSGASERRARDPVPLQLALWTDAPAYRTGESVRLYRTLRILIEKNQDSD